MSIPAPLRPRRDGWTPDAQAVFVAALGTMSVGAAAAAGMSRWSAYRLRDRNAVVAAAWGVARTASEDDLADAAESGLATRAAAAAEAAYPGGDGVWLLRQLRREVRLTKRRAAAAIRHENTVVV